MLYASNYPLIRPTASAMAGADLRKAFLRMRANSIEGGTSEVMRNIIGERVLGLPGEPRGDKDLAVEGRPPQLGPRRGQSNIGPSIRERLSS